MQRIFNLLPAPIQADYLSLWDEWVTEQSADAKFANALGRAVPLIQSMLDDGHRWKVNNTHRQHQYGQHLVAL